MENKQYTPCGGCGAETPIDRCIGCMHPFTKEEEKVYNKLLTPERDLILRIVEQWGNAIEMPNMEQWLKDYAGKAPTGPRWVKGTRNFPVKKPVIAKKFISYLNKEVVGTASSATGEMICFDWGVSSVCLAIGHEELNDLYWLDEQPAAGREEVVEVKIPVSIALYEFVRDCAQNWDCDSDGHRYETGCRKCEAKGLFEILKHQKDNP